MSPKGIAAPFWEEAVKGYNC